MYMSGRYLLPIWSSFSTSGIGRFGIYCFAFFAFLGTAGANIGLLIAFICTCYTVLLNRDRHLSDSIYILVNIIILYFILRTILSVYEDPNLGKMQLVDCLPWLLLWFPMVSYWLLGNAVKITLSLLFLSATGLFFKTLSFLLFDTKSIIKAFIDTQPYVFGGTASGVALIYMIHILGLVIFFPRALKRINHPNFRVVFIISYAILILIFSQALILAQSRGGWISLGIVLPVCAIIFYWPKLSFKFLSRKYILLGIVISITLASTITYSNKNILLKRFNADHETYAAIFNGDFNNIPYSSLGYRVLLIMHGVKKWLEKPMLGWGPMNSKHLIQQSEDQNLHSMAHYHNSVIEVLVHYGALGLLLVGLLVVLMILKLYQSNRAGFIPSDLYIFLLGTFALMFIWGMGSSRIIHVDWRFLWLLLSGTSYALLQPQNGLSTHR